MEYDSSKAFTNNDNDNNNENGNDKENDNNNGDDDNDDNNYIRKFVLTGTVRLELKRDTGCMDYLKPIAFLQRIKVSHAILNA